MSSSVNKGSPSSKFAIILSLFPVKYFTKIVISVISSDELGSAQSLTNNSIPEFCPFNFFPFKLSRYKDIGRPKCSDSNLTEKYLSSYATPPGRTIDPSLNT